MVCSQLETLGRGRTPRLIRVNERGGMTFVLEGNPQCFLKWSPPCNGAGLQVEASRLEWAGRYSDCVPRVLGVGAGRGGSWLLTRALQGQSAADPSWRGRPHMAARAAGEGLRAFHEAFPVERCPFEWSAASRIVRAYERARAGQIDPSRWHPNHRTLTVDRALEEVSEVPGIDRLVVCHGDASVSNAILDRGRCTGYVDLGSLGIADRWADIALATWSTTWHYGPGFEAALLAGYGISPSPRISRFYRLLWDLGR